MNKTIAILYGLGEGEHIRRKLIKLLNKNGFDISNNPESADYIIAHSGGVFFIPEKNNAKICLLTAPSLSTNSSMLKMQISKAAKDFDHAKSQKMLFAWYKKSIINLYYLLKNIPYEFKMFQLYKHYKNNLKITNTPKVIVVTYSKDDWANSITNDIKTRFSKYVLL